ncbi:MAG: hypothetical protein R3253_12880 [Longimicrobiales bacterium]|nr:hypothetical protein [Longimicrobiales bacterium]
MSPLRRILKEAHRRDLWQVLGIFIGGGWGFLQVLDLFIERGFVPEWVFGGALLALVAGLPVVLVTAYVQRGLGTRPAASPGDPEVQEDGGDGGERTLQGLFTWRNAIGGGVAAFALLGVLTAGYMLMRVTGIGSPGTLVAQGVFEQGGEVVLADFESSVPETVPGELITEALRIDLAQSQTLRLLPNSTVNAALERMRRDPADGLPADVALELAAREGAEGVISGEVARAGSTIVITARLAAAGTGDELAAFRVAADAEDAVIDAIDELSRRMREKVGESLRSVARSEPLERVATSSVEALQRYTLAAQGLDRGTISPPVAIQMFQEAVALDSTFSAAHRALSVAINNVGGDRELAARSVRAAYRHRHRLPERERLFTEASYHMFIGNEAEAIRSFRSLLTLDPTSVGAATNLTHLLGFAGRYDEVLDVAAQLSAYDESTWVWNLAAAHTALGNVEEALSATDSLRVRAPELPWFTMVDSYILGMSGRVDEARTLLLEAPPSSDPVPRAYEIYMNGVLHTLSGELRAASEILDGVERFGGETSGPSVQLSYGLATPWTAGLIEGDTARAAQEVEKLKREVRWEELSAYNRDYGMLALTWAVLGYQEEAERMLDGFQDVAEGSDPWARSSARLGAALVAIRRGESDGVRELEVAAEDHPCHRCGLFVRGLGYELAGERRKAIEVYEEYVRYPFFDAPTFLLHIFAPAVHERLGELYEAEGDSVRAAQHYQAFAEAWSQADAALQPRVLRARERAEALGG